MGNCSPCNLRRKGKEAFDPNIDPMDIQPFNPRSWWYSSNLDDWLEGWNMEKKEYEAEEKREEEEREEEEEEREEVNYANSNT